MKSFVRFGLALVSVSSFGALGLAACDDDSSLSAPPFGFDGSVSVGEGGVTPPLPHDDAAPPFDASDDGRLDATVNVDAATTYPVSCKEVLERTPDAPSGQYLIDPDGEGLDAGPDADAAANVAPFLAYCDMTYAEADSGTPGGWTLFYSLIMNDAGGSVASTEASSVNAGEAHYLSAVAAQALAAQSQQIHIRWTGYQGTDKEISATTYVYDTSTDAGAYLHPIQNLRAGRILNWETDYTKWHVVMKGDPSPTATPDWYIQTGLAHDQSGLALPPDATPAGGCGPDAAGCRYPGILMWTWGTADGMGITNGAGTWHRLNWGATPFELYVR